METQDSEDVVATVEHLLRESAELAHAMFRESGIKATRVKQIQAGAQVTAEPGRTWLFHGSCL